MATDEARQILEKLPELLRRTPQLRYQIYDLLAERFVEKAEIGRLLDELKVSREETNRRFDEAREETNRRFDEAREETNRRFEAVDKRFEAVDKRFEVLVAELKALREEFNRGFQDTRDWVGTVVGGFQNRAGKSLEEAIAGTLRVALKMKDLDPASIRLRQKLTDTQGLIGPAGRSYEYDILATNGGVCIFEVKSVPDAEDAERFADKCRLVAQVQGWSDPRRVIVTLVRDTELVARCRELGIELA